MPSAAVTMPAPTAAAEPLLDPPGVRAVSCGLRVAPKGCAMANSVVTVLPRMIAPAARSAATEAESFCERQPSNSGEPNCVGMSAVSIISLIAIGMPSIGDAGFPAAQRAVERSAAERAPSMFNETKAATRGSQWSSAARLRSRNLRGVSAPERNFSAAARKGSKVGFS